MFFSAASAKTIFSRRTPKLQNSVAEPLIPSSFSSSKNRLPFFSLRPVSAMASQSSKTSIYDFTVK
ncbi:hypothetical protein MKW94_029731, partial [Papaver nudicaule]|nr:hypothetical protein [Papaver nudicaule]